MYKLTRTAIKWWSLLFLVAGGLNPQETTDRTRQANKWQVSESLDLFVAFEEASCPKQNIPLVQLKLVVSKPACLTSSWSQSSMFNQWLSALSPLSTASPPIHLSMIHPVINGLIQFCDFHSAKVWIIARIQKSKNFFPVILRRLDFVM